MAENMYKENQWAKFRFHVECSYCFDNITLNFCFYNTECCIERKRWIEALIKHYKAQKERSNLSFIDSDIQPHEEAQKKGIIQS